MWFRKNKIKENPKRLPFRGRQQSHNYSSWDNMSIVEQFAMIFLPSAQCFLFYTMLGVFELVWWIKLGLAVGIVVGFMTLITLFITWLHGE